ncbi:MAG: pseudouridylate synthase [Lentisphaerae bacterium]|nr:pseudouridylate synthase [Lentisphaerota bacterium]
MGLLRILHADEHVVAIDKPDGLLVHRTRISSDHTFALQLLRDQLGRLVYPVHRLDRPTSGVLLFALDPETASKLCADFAGRKVKKTYLAVVRGYLDESGTVDYPLKDSEGGEGIQATTLYRRSDTAELPFADAEHATSRVSLASVTPLTGRMHQIRRHFRHISHPVIGDTRYGDGRYNRLFREKYGVRRLLLHAFSVAFTHPATGDVKTVTAPPPEEVTRLFSALGLEVPPV